MKRSATRVAALIAALIVPTAGFAQQAGVASEVIDKIKDEGLNHSQVMQTLSYLSDVIGPRLTGSPGLKRANDWTKSKFTDWGLQNAHLEAWGPFGRGWTLKKFSAQVVEPLAIPLIAYPKAWSPGVKTAGEVVYVDAKTEADLAKYKGKLKGAIVLNGSMRDVKAHFEALGTRMTDSELLEFANSGGSAQRQRGVPGGRPVAPGTPGAPTATATPATNFQQIAQFNSAKAKFYMDEGVALIVDASPRGDGGTIFVQSATVPGASFAPGARRISPWQKDAPKILPQMVVAVEHYNRMARMCEAGEKVKMAVDCEVQFQDQDAMAYNTVAEIPGSDKKDELVMVGAHMDSWHSGTGATDNGAGCAVAMEAVRILKTLNLQPRRTVRVALWSGEEQGLMGSRAYVAQHFGAYPQPGGGGGGFGAPPTGTLDKKPEFDKLSVYFNLDNGTGKVRGVYLQGNEAARPLFRDWLRPFTETGAATISLSNTGGTDHLSFDGIGLPGFQFIQDEIEYETRTHHSNQDVFDRIQADDMKQAAVIMATCIYQAAMRDDMFPRKPAK